MNNLGVIIFTGIVAGDVILLRETSDLFIGLVLVFYALMCKFMKNPGIVSLKVSIASLIFMYISFLRQQHNPTAERFAVWTVVFLLVSLVIQFIEFIKQRERNFRNSL